MTGGRVSPRCFIPRRHHVRRPIPSALVRSEARIDASAEIGPHAVVGVGAEIGPDCGIASFVSVGAGVTVRRDRRAGAYASLVDALLGSRIHGYPGARIGPERRGYATTKTDFLSILQLGRMIVEDDLEVGANWTIDRGSVRDTVIGAGTCIDNLVQIGNNVRLGDCCVIVAEVSIAGPTMLKDFVQLGGQAALAGHLCIGQGSQIGALAGVSPMSLLVSVWLGSPAQPREEFLREIATLKRMTRRPR